MLTGDMLRRSAGRFPDKDAIVWGAVRMSYAALDAAANRCAHGLAELAPRAGAKIGIICGNRPEYGVVFFGAARSGAVLVNVSVLYSPTELAYVLDKADVEVAIVEEPFAARLAGILEDLPKLRHVVAIGAGVALPDAIDFAALLAGRPETAPAVAIDDRDAFCMTYTGGTTGRPKGVLASHRARALTAHTVVVEEGLEARDVVGIVTPMFHVAALNIMFQPAILIGATTTMLSKWEPAAFAAMARGEQMTAAFMVPTQAAMVLQDPGFDAADYASWRKLAFAGAPMPDWVQRDLMARLPNLRLTQIYGQSEMGVIAALPHWHLPGKLGSVGRAVFNADIACVRPDGSLAGPGEVGEIVSRGGNLMIGYYGEPGQTAAFFKYSDGWGWSGDLATVDADGFFTLVDRSKDMIISGGENVYPMEIETALYEHEAVAECAVFGIPDATFGEVPAAHVSLKPGKEATAEALIAHCRQRLAEFKRPRLIEFVADFPKTPIGKIQKTILKEPYWRDRDKKI